ncbi:MAG: alpha-ribazole phosphatase [Acetivibrionales bacterium]|jgi:alpha-ribazole phosphatase
MQQLIFIRHGETDSSKRGTYCGWTDIGLNKKGINQAYRIADKLKNEQICQVFSSPLRRTVQTAEIIKDSLSLTVSYVDSLKERNFGEWDDLSYEEIREKYPQELAQWDKDWINYRIKNGESAIEAHLRVTAFIDRLIEKNNNGTFLFVTHLGCIRSLLAHLLGMGIEGTWRFRVQNGSITRVLVNDEKFAYLTCLNAF